MNCKNCISDKTCTRKKEQKDKESCLYFQGKAPKRKVEVTDEWLFDIESKRGKKK